MTSGAMSAAVPDVTLEHPAVASRAIHGGAAETSQRRHVGRGGGRTPWAESDSVLVAILSTIGAGGLVVCWWGISSEANWHHQLSWLAGAIASVGVAGLGAALWLHRGRRRVRLAASEVWIDLRDRSGQRADLLARWQPPAAQPGETADSVPGRVATPAMTRHHDISCELVRGKADVTAVTSAEIEGRGLRPCGVCAE